MRRTKTTNIKYHKKIIIMGEYFSSGLWSLVFGCMINYKDLPSSIYRHRKKIQNFQKKWNQIYLSSYTYSTPILTKKFFNSKKFKDLQKEIYFLGKLIKKNTNQIDIFVYDEILFDFYSNKILPKDSLYKKKIVIKN